jgi:hypothetical protein
MTHKSEQLLSSVGRLLPPVIWTRNLTSIKRTWSANIRSRVNEYTAMNIYRALEDISQAALRIHRALHQFLRKSLRHGICNQLRRKASVYCQHNGI